MAEPFVEGLEPHFPAGAYGALSSRDEARARALIDAMDAWRSTLDQRLRSVNHGISPELAALLRSLLGSTREALPRLSYRIAVYPAAVDDPVTTMRARLLWRGGIVDFLSDVWDTIGPAPFSIDECARASRWFVPAGFSHDVSCALCLDPLAGGAGARAHHFSCCPFQLAWVMPGGDPP